MRLPSFLVLLTVLRTTVSQTTVTGYTYVGEGVVDTGTSGSYGPGGGSTGTLAGCGSFCDGTSNLVGFTFVPGVPDGTCSCIKHPTGLAIAAPLNLSPGSFTYAVIPEPTSQPSSQPSSHPSGQPSSVPSEEPSSIPSSMPSGQPSSVPSQMPSSQPSSIPSGQPSSVPSEMPSAQPSSVPSEQPSSMPSSMPSSQPSSVPSEQPSSVPSEMPSSQPSSVPSEQPSSIPSSMPSGQPSSMPSEMPSAQPSSAPSGQPSSIPSEMPSSQPSSVPSEQPSSIPSEMPSSQPSSVPSEQPSSVPSEMPSSQPSSVPSEQPSSVPSEMPSSMPSEMPSEQPSSQPSRQPTSQPSEQPSTQPSCTPSMAPSDPEKTFLFYPNWVPDGSGCLNDGNEPGYMSAAPSYYMHSTLDSCCSTYFGWNFDVCSGNLPGICARSLYYPDWEGSNEGCIDDGNEPRYIRDNYMWYMFSKLEDCCKTHYAWNYFSCVGNAGLQNAELFYPDWENDADSCKDGGGQPPYMNTAPDDWMHATITECCTDYFNWNYDVCIGSSSSAGSGSANAAAAANGKYYPDWSSNDHVCRSDGNQMAYMTNNQAHWMYDDLKSCCKDKYQWNYDVCIASVSTPSATPGSGTAPTTSLYYPNLHYPDWPNRSQVCANDGGQPTYMSNNPEVWMYVELKDCCKERFPQNYDVCVGSSNNLGTNKYYVRDYSKGCVQDCVGASPCGGFAKSWHFTYDSKAICCQQRLWWEKECITM